MRTLRVDPERLPVLIRQQGFTQKTLGEQIEKSDQYVNDLKHEVYLLLSRAAAIMGENPIMLLSVDGDGRLMVDKAHFLDSMHEAGYSRERLAETLGVHENTIANLYNYHFPKLNRVALGMGVSPLALLKVED